MVEVMVDCLVGTNDYMLVSPLFSYFAMQTLAMEEIRSTI
jgi:hypothetical protein